MGLELENIRYAHGPGHTDLCFGKEKHVLTCGSDGFVRIWNGLDDDDSSSDFVADQAISITCTSDRYLVATSNNYVQGYTYSDRKRDKIIFRFSGPVTCVTTSSNNKFIAACSCDMEIQLLNTKTNKITVLSGHSAPVLSLSFDPLEEYLVSSSCDGTVKIWDLISGSSVKTFTSIIPVTNNFFKAIVLGQCAWKSMSGLLLAVPKDSNVIVYKRNTWEQLYALSSKNIEKGLSGVLFSPCGNYLAGASVTGEVIIWEIKHKSEVCCYKDAKKVGISRMVWQSDGCKILFCDRLGRFGVLSGISEEISKHSVPAELTIKLCKDKSEKGIDESADSNSVIVDDEDDENCISIDKIKASYINASDDDDDDNDDYENENSESADTFTISKSGILNNKNAILISDLQQPFQPSSTPSNFEPRCLCYNDVGMIRYYDSDRTIDIQFHDTTLHHSLFLRSFGVCTMASLNSKVICLAAPSVGGTSSKMMCICLSSWAGKKEWTVYMPEEEDVEAVAASGDWVAVATNLQNLRIFSHAGLQKQILSLPGRVVSMAGHGQKLMVVYHSGPGVYGSQNLSFIIFKLLNHHVRTLAPYQCLPISPKSTLKWLGFSDEGTPSTHDSEGNLRLLGHDSSHWMLICNTKFKKKCTLDNYFVVGLNETSQNIRCIHCRNSQYPLFISNPTVLEIPLKMPVCEVDDAKSSAEETFWRLMFSMYNVRKSCPNSNEIYSKFELPMTQAILKLFGEACNNSEDLRAVNLATFMTKKPLDVAIKYASNQGKTYLVQKLRAMKPVDWTSHHTGSLHFSRPAPEFENTENKSPVKDPGDNFINSQQDLFEDSVASNENIKGNDSPESEESADQCETNFPVNLFKKPNVPVKNSPTGLKYFDSLHKEQFKQKPFYVNKPPKLKLLSNKEKKTEAKAKKPTFVEWFGKRKGSLSEEYPNLSSGELTKMGMKLYKEEMSRIGGECKTGRSFDSESGFLDSSKRTSSGDAESNPKRFKVSTIPPD